MNPENLTVRELAEMLNGMMTFEMLCRSQIAGTHVEREPQTCAVSGVSAWEVFRDMFRISSKQKRGEYL